MGIQSCNLCAPRKTHGHIISKQASTVKKCSKEANSSALGIQKTEIDQKGQGVTDKTVTSPESFIKGDCLDAESESLGNLRENLERSKREMTPSSRETQF